MKRLLTIAIPTFNRPDFLDQQLSWLNQAIQGFDADCEIIISDDGSTDHTSQIIQKWQTAFGNAAFRLNINEQNQGPVPNIARCIQLATSRYVWVVGDDDQIEDTTLAYVINSLKANSNLSALILNYSIYYAPVERIVCDRFFEIEQEEVGAGKVLLERVIAAKNAANGIGFVTSLIYKTAIAQRAIQAWLPSTQNFEAPAYWTGFCGLYGEVQISRDVQVQYNCGMNSKPIDKNWFRYHYADLPAVYSKLAEIGYSRKLFQNLLIQHLQQSNLRVILGSLRRWPIMTIWVMLSYFKSIASTFWNRSSDRSIEVPTRSSIQEAVVKS